MPAHKKGHIIIATDYESEIERLEEELKPFRVVKFVEENFKIEHVYSFLQQIRSSANAVMTSGLEGSWTSCRFLMAKLANYLTRLV